MSAAQSHKSVKRFDAHSSAADVEAALHEHGVAVIENLVQGEDLARLQAELGAWFDASPLGEGEFFGQRTMRFGAVFAKAQATHALAIHPLVLGVMQTHLRGPDPKAPRCDEIEISATQAIGIGPGEGDQFLHRDEALWPFVHDDFPVMANAMWMIDDFTVENGGTRVIPKSHTWPLDREPQPGQTMRVSGPAGSVLLWTGRLLHAGGKNETEKMRRGLVLSYKLGWLAPQEKLLLTHPPEMVRSFPPELQRLIGYQLHKPNLGWIEGRDPIEWLKGEIGEVAATRDNFTPELEALLADVRERPEAYAGHFG
jgi:ectoine hydroxylase-related dioxygenase (phytanoyl-CoA dioxygenase family)